MKNLLLLGSLWLYSATLFGQNAFDLDWIQPFQGSNTDYVTHFVVDASGAAIVVGQFQSEINFGTASLPFVLTEPVGVNFSIGIDSFIAKYDVEGNFVWVKRLGGIGTQYISSIVIDSQGNFLISGELGAATDFDLTSGENIQTPSNASNGFIAKYDADFNFLWYAGIEGSGYSGVDYLVVDADGSAIGVGTYHNYCNFDPNGNGIWLGTIGPHDDIFMLRISSDGDPISAFKIGGEEMETLRDVEINSIGNVFYRRRIQQ